MNLLVVIVVLACLAGSVSLEGIRYDDDTNNHVRQTRGSESVSCLCWSLLVNSR